MPRSKRSVYCCCGLMLLGLVAVIVCVALYARRTKCPEGTFSSVAVAADSGKCSQIGRDMIRKGGSAVDGAIAALLCTSLINPQSMGLGGGSIFTVMDASGNVKIINSRETVPGVVKPGLLESCPKTFQPISGISLSDYQMAILFSFRDSVGASLVLLVPTVAEILFHMLFRRPKAMAAEVLFVLYTCWGLPNQNVNSHRLGFRLRPLT